LELTAFPIAVSPWQISKKFAFLCFLKKLDQGVFMITARRVEQSAQCRVRFCSWRAHVNNASDERRDADVRAGRAAALALISPGPVFPSLSPTLLFAHSSKINSSTSISPAQIPERGNNKARARCSGMDERESETLISMNSLI